MPTLTVKGMSCNHCKQAVTKALEAIPGVSDVSVDLEKGEASWTESRPVDIAEVKKAINTLGFEA
ncbi:heavy-metal-associated domain-containing protein [uncultured Bilophila sp.]|jgi:copper chaperone|uniref:heavy-metal-associated domain-containing protein n=1 Tax=uncultured Bilophila sp. TaxID=529385 RepID=UPI0025D4B027|nr:cation transporter [uncultured Bilophila sp.]